MCKSYIADGKGTSGRALTAALRDARRFTTMSPLGLLAGFAVSLGGYAEAATPDDSVVAVSPATGSQSDAQADTLQEVVVSATRREESIQKVPVSVKALSQDDLIQGNIQNIADIAAVTPGLQFTAPGLAFSTITSVAIRGVNTDTGPSVVGIYLDDTPIQARLSPVGNIGSAFPLLFDLSRVEVDRGPQGTLFGAGSEAGTLRFITNQPSLTELTGFAHAEAASTDNGGWSEEGGAAVGGPIVTDEVGFRLSAWVRHDGGYVDLISPIDQSLVSSNVNTDDKVLLRGALTFKVNDQIRITPSVDFQSVRSDDSGRFFAIFSNASAGVFNNATLLPEIYSDHFLLPSIKFQEQLPFAELTVVTSYYHRVLNMSSSDQSGFLGAVGAANYGSPLGPSYATSPLDVAPDPTGQTDRAFTEEVRLTSSNPDAFVTWVAGLFNDHRTQEDWQRYYSQIVVPTPPPNLVYAADQVIKDEQTALFAQGDFHLTKKLIATLGGRVARVKVEQSNAYGNGPFNAGVPPLSYSGESETPFTPRFGLSYQLDPGDLLYTTVAKGFRVGGGNGKLPDMCNTITPSGYRSDDIWSYEVGAKNALLNGRLLLDSSVYYLKWSNIQQLVSEPCGFQYTGNLGTAASDGFDLALEALVIEGLRLRLDVGYTNAYYTQNVYSLNGAPIALAGEKIGSLPQVNAPWDVNTSVNYSVPVGVSRTFYARGEYRYHSHNPGPFINQVPTAPNYLPQLAADPPTHLFNARLGTTVDKLDLALYMDNVFNSHPDLGAFAFAPTSNYITYQTFRPRTTGLSVSYSY
jgi:iron complex outermembrane recepter protein